VAVITDGVQLIDHHVHAVVRGPLDATGVEALLTESFWPPAAGTSAWDSQLGFAVRRWCAPLLDLEPGAPPQAYLERRAELGPDEVNRRLLAAARVAMWLVDTGYQTTRLLTPADVERLSGAPARQILRLEPLAEQVLASGGTAAGFAAGFGAALHAASAGAVGLKSIAAYRYGLDLGPVPPPGREVAAAAGRYLAASRYGEPARLADPALIRHLVWAGVETGLPLQFHTGFGDPDVRLHRADPSLLHDFLLAARGTGTAVMLLHCYPFHRQAGYLANVFPHVYLDVGQALNHVGARSAAVLAEALELAPFTKILYSSDAFGLPELHYLGAAGFRRDLDRVLGGLVADGAWTAPDAERVAGLIGAGNARRVYRLAGP
jgi:predicted TIM-barrel fold metal-dependent hydrolase